MSTMPAVSTFKVGLTAEEKELYSKLFKALDSENSGIVTGEKVRSTFEKSGLPANILGEIWQLSDTQNLGFLTQFSFCHAMRLIGYTQAGHYPTAQLAQSPGPLPKFAKLGLPQPSLNPQSTSGSLLQSQPSALVPQNTATQQSLPQQPISPVSKADFEKFSQIYVKTTGSSTAPLDANSAKEILMKAKLPTVILGQIWSLVDVKNEGALNLSSFVMAMHLIHGLLSGQLKQLPPFLPEQVWQSVRVAPAEQNSGARQVSSSSMSSQSSTVRHAPTSSQGVAQSEWEVTPTQKQQFDSIFSSLDKAKTEQLAADQVASFLMTSRLDQQDLATIWDLSDIQNTGVFGRLEFGIALFLINRKRAGLSLPNVVPEQLIKSLAQTPQAPQAISAPQAPEQTQQTQQIPESSINLTAISPEKAQRSVSAPKSSLDDLVDIFGSSGQTKTNTASELSVPQRPSLPQRTSNSELTYGRSPVSTTFRPTSSFGQSLLNKQPSSNEADLIGEDIPSKATGSPVRHASLSVPAAAPSADTKESKHKTVDYEALRSVPAPPRSRSSMISPSPLAQQQPTSSVFPETQPKSENLPENNDLLADSEVSGQLSEATSDIANFSNQIKSLSGQTSALDEKKLRAEAELTKILAVKEEINSKLKSLRISYANEVKQVEQVVLTLGNAKEETEALRSEASIAEAKFNNITNELHEKQLQVEEHQKINSSLKEKLGNLNAENAELEKELVAKTAEVQRLTNDVNVRKSQVQVSLVKLDELKGKISDSESQYAKLLDEHEKSVRELEMHESEQKKLHEKHQELGEKHKELGEKQSFNKLVAGAAGAVGGLAAGAGAALLNREDSSSGSESDSHTEKQEPTQDESGKEIGSHGAEKSVLPESQSVPSGGDFTETTKGSNAISQPETSQDVGDEFGPKVAVDAVANEFSSDLTGVDDAAKGHDPVGDAFRDNVETTEKSGLPDYNDDMQELHSRFPDLSNTYNAETQDVHGSESTNRESPSSAIESFRQTETNESGATPVTSPANSEYRFQTVQTGLVAGMAGIPGGLVGVQRTDSLTSSVQNNPSLSVRDDNVEEVSDRETVGEEVAVPKATQRSNYDGSSEGERASSGVGSFEIVNAEEAKGAQANDKFKYGKSVSASNDEEEFPSPQELDIDESSSDSEAEAATEKFDDAVDKFTGGDKDSDFDDLKPTVADDGDKDDFFGDEFDDLKVAHEDKGDDFEDPNLSIDDHFTGAEVQDYHHSTAPDFSTGADSNKAPDFNAAAELSTAPDFTSGPNFITTKTDRAETDEWEQLFAGFGNAAVQEPSSGAGAEAGAKANNLTGTSSGPSNDTHDLAVQELVAMGFEKSAVVKALEKENWDVDAATNYLLDTA